MPLRLPTDTQHINLRTRQFELFGRSLGQGVERQTLLVVGLAVVVWWSVLLLIGLPLFTRYAPLVYLVPPAAFVVNGTRRDDTGRMVLARWWDRLLALHPARRRQIVNPLLPPAARTKHPVRIVVTAELVPTLTEDESEVRT